MARPTKEFLDYFPFYCRGDDRTDILKAKKGMSGFGVYISLLIKLYGEKGYYINWNDNVCCIFSNYVNVPEDEVADIVDLLIKIGLFDKEIFEKHSVLTSKEIQENYLYAITKRKNKKLDERFNLVCGEETPVSGEETPVYGTESTQRKENKRKENKIIEKEKELDASENPDPAPAKRGIRNNVVLTEAEYDELKAKYPDVDYTVDRLSTYMASTGKSYPDHYATLIRWAEEDMTRTSIAPVYKQYRPKQQANTKAASPKRESSFDIDEFYQFAVSRDPRSCLT
ncbi:MAG: DUF4373 domain-containing protein [Clostridia bacterium]|nr:DUF4373 domain-containing protein [Clostridia bacterium]